jgi:uncharacterized protein with von Willebrand factor type A (vWA) domain
MIALLQALRHVNISRKEDFYYALLGLLVRKREEIQLFDQAFAIFWGKRTGSRLALNIPRKGGSETRKRSTLSAHKSLDAKSVPLDKASADRGDDAELESIRTYSPHELLRHKDFADMSTDEVLAVKQQMANLVWRLGYRRTRRRRAGFGPSIDFRRSLRSSLRYGGEMIVWSRRKPKLKPRPLVIIADTSGSMEQFTRMLLHFAYFLTRGLDQTVEVFVFSTRLTRITRQLRSRSIGGAMEEVSIDVSDWSGGTRIGEAVKSFNYDWARRTLTRGAVVMLISDGWDRGDPELLKKEIARLQRSCYRLIWLNPLLGAPQYEPLTRGMRTALPYIDDFMPVHSLATLEDLANHLSQLDERRPFNRNQYAFKHRWKSEDFPAW